MLGKSLTSGPDVYPSWIISWLLLCKKSLLFYLHEKLIVFVVLASIIFGESLRSTRLLSSPQNKTTTNHPNRFPAPMLIFSHCGCENEREGPAEPLSSCGPQGIWTASKTLLWWGAAVPPSASSWFIRFEEIKPPIPSGKLLSPDKGKARAPWPALPNHLHGAQMPSAALYT